MPSIHQTRNRLQIVNSDSFMFSNDNGPQAVKKDDFIRIPPKRCAAFKSAGLLSSKIKSLGGKSG